MGRRGARLDCLNVATQPHENRAFCRQVLQSNSRNSLTKGSSLGGEDPAVPEGYQCKWHSMARTSLSMCLISQYTRLTGISLVTSAEQWLWICVLLWEPDILLPPLWPGPYSVSLSGLVGSIPRNWLFAYPPSIQISPSHFLFLSAQASASQITADMLTARYLVTLRPVL